LTNLRLLFNKSEKFDKIKSQLNKNDLTRRVTDDMVASPIEHKQPIIGVLDWPYRETGMSGASHYSVVGFLCKKAKSTPPTQSPIKQKYGK